MLLIRGGWLWPGPGEDVQNDAAVLCDGDKIVSVGDFAELRTLAPEARIVGNHNALVVPGFINAHHHGRGIDTFNLGAVDDLLELYLARRGQMARPDRYLDTLWAAYKLLAQGVTTVVHYNTTVRWDSREADIRESLRAWNDAGIRVAFGVDLRQRNWVVYTDEDLFLASLPSKTRERIQSSIPAAERVSFEAYLDSIESLKNYENALTRLFLAPVGPEWVSEETLQGIATFAAEKDLKIHLHTEETPYQHVAAHETYNRSWVRLLGDLGVLGDRTSLIHAIWLDEDDIELLAATQTSVVHNPGANLRLRSGTAPVLRLVQAGVRVALGTDSSTFPEDDLLAEARLAYHLHRPPGLHADAIDREQIFSMMTENAAHVTPYGQTIGFLAPGNLADLAVYDLQSMGWPYTNPDVHPLDLLLRKGNPQQLLATVVGGDIKYLDGKIVGVDIDKVAQELAESVVLPEKNGSGALVERIRSHFRNKWLPD